MRRNQSCVTIVIVCLGIFLGILFSSCGSSYLPYPLNAPLSTESFLSRENLFTGRVPQGWFYASQDTLGQGLAAWVVREDFGAALAVKELHPDALTAKRIQKEGLNLLASMSLSFQSAGKKKLEVDLYPKEFTIKNRKYSGYEFSEGATHKRVVVFGAGSKYFECVATPMKGTWTLEQTNKLFAAQQAFLTTLVF